MNWQNERSLCPFNLNDLTWKFCQRGKRYHRDQFINILVGRDSHRLAREFIQGLNFKIILHVLQEWVVGCGAVSKYANLVYINQIN